MDARRLNTLVSDYANQCGRRRACEHDRYADMPDLKTAIWNAALARREDGKCEFHQRRVGMARLAAFERAVQRKSRGVAGCKTFDALYHLVDGVRPRGVGPLTAYDTALRIGRYLGLEPERVYLHAGTRAGAAVLGLGRGRDYLEGAELPVPIRRLSYADIENFLCIYKDALRGGPRPGRGPGCPEPRSGKRALAC